MNNLEKRWLEVQYYLYITEFLDVTGSLDYLLNYLEILAQISEINLKKLQQITISMLSNPKFKPNKDELVILCARCKGVKNRLKIKYQIIEWKMRKIIKEDAKDPKMYFPVLKDDELEEIINFFETTKVFEELGARQYVGQTTVRKVIHSIF